MRNDPGHLFRILYDSSCHPAGGDQLPGIIRGVHAEDRDGHGAFHTCVVSVFVQSGNDSFRHVVVVANDQLDHVIPGDAVFLQIGQHVALCRVVGPGTRQVQLEMVIVGGIEIFQMGIACLLQHRVGILYGIAGPVDGFRIQGFSLEKGIADDPVPVQVCFTVMVTDIFADHLSLHMAGLGRVRSHKSDVVILIEEGPFFILSFYGLVEKDHPDISVPGLFNDLCGGLGVARGNEVDDQKIDPRR